MSDFVEGVKKGLEASGVDVSGLDGSIIAGLGTFLIIFAFIVIVCGIFTLIAEIILYKKCNKPGWAVIVPYYNIWVECEIVGAHWLIFAFSIISSVLSLFELNTGFLSTITTLLYYFANIVMMFNLAKKFHKGVGFTIGLVLLPIVFVPILAFSKNCVYDKDAEVKNCGFFNVNF